MKLTELLTLLSIYNNVYIIKDWNEEKKKEAYEYLYTEKEKMEVIKITPFTQIELREFSKSTLVEPALNIYVKEIEEE